MTLAIGLMSGTSMDGIDAALVDIDVSTHQHNLLHAINLEYSSELISSIRSIQAADFIKIGDLSQLNIKLGYAFAAAALKLLSESKLNSKDILVIGSHGQTIIHDINANPPYTIQLGCGHVIAEQTNINVVSDFRSRDLVLGGQGAPFAPLYHHELWHQQKQSLAIINIGGISNISILNTNGDLIGGYDLGPGNVLMDLWARKYLNLPFDKNGDWAASGKVDEELLSRLLSDGFFQKTAPKSACYLYFSYEYLNSYLPLNFDPKDVQATLLKLTVISIKQSINNKFEKILICGGGAKNLALMKLLKSELAPVPIYTTTDVGINSDFLEAMMMAWLGTCTMLNMPMDYKSITGSKKSAIYGVIYPK